MPDTNSIFTGPGISPRNIAIGLVGGGYWGPNLSRNFSRVAGGEIVAVCDLEEKRLQSLANHCHDARRYSDYGELLADPTVDAVVLATPAPLHSSMALRAIEAGKHVFVEKPLCLSSVDARLLVQKAKTHDCVLMVGHLLEYHPVITFLSNLIKNRELGEIYYLYSQRLNLGQVRREENALWSLAPHDISIANLLLGGRPQSVTATGQAFLQHNIHDVVFLTLTYPGGRIAHIHVSWLDPHKTRQITLVGSKQMAVFDDMAASEKLRIYNKGFDLEQAIQSGSRQADLSLKIRFGDVNIPWIEPTEPLLLECQHFIDSIRSGSPPLSDGEDGLRVVEVLEAAQQSLDQGGQPVELREMA